MYNDSLGIWTFNHFILVFIRAVYQVTFKDPSQPPPFSMPSKLLILHGEAKSYCLTVSCVPESMFHCLL